MTNQTKTARAVAFVLDQARSFRTKNRFGEVVLTPYVIGYEYDEDAFARIVKRAAKLAKLDEADLFDACADAAVAEGIIVFER